MNTASHLPETCLIEGVIPDPRRKKLTSAEREHVTHYHSTYGGSMNLAWYQRLNLPPAVRSLLSYQESLLVITEAGDAVGKCFISVTTTEWGGEECLLVHAASFATLGDGAEIGADITGFITPKFKVIQELCHEWTNSGGKLVDRKTFLMREGDNKLFCQVILQVEGEVKEKDSFHIPFAYQNTFVSEATSILLQRLIIQQKRTGEIQLHSLNSKGNVVGSSFRVLGTGFENIHGENTKVWGIRRSVWPDQKRFSAKNQKEFPIRCGSKPKKGRGEGYSWDSLFNYYGRLVLRCQPDNDHALIPLWFKPVFENDDFGNFIGALPPLLWACDMEFHSYYLSKKAELTAEYKTYLLDHPRLRAVLSDFLQRVLLVKPRSPVDFAKHFFTPFLLARPDSAEDDGSRSDSSQSWESGLGEGGAGEWGGEDKGIFYPRPPYRAEEYFYNPRFFISTGEALGEGGFLIQENDDPNQMWYDTKKVSKQMSKESVMDPVLHIGPTPTNDILEYNNDAGSMTDIENNFDLDTGVSDFDI